MEIRWPALMVSKDCSDFISFNEKQTWNKVGLEKAYSDRFFYDKSGNKFSCISIAKKGISWEDWTSLVFLNPSYHVEYHLDFINTFALEDFKQEIEKSFLQHRDYSESRFGNPMDFDEDYYEIHLKAIKNANDFNQIIELFF